MSRATEEIQWLNIETKMIATWIAHEALEMDEAITACTTVDPALSEAYHSVHKQAQVHELLNYR